MMLYSLEYHLIYRISSVTSKKQSKFKNLTLRHCRVFSDDTITKCYEKGVYYD